jgi:hypothetical protein
VVRRLSFHSYPQHLLLVHAPFLLQGSAREVRRGGLPVPAIVSRRCSPSRVARGRAPGRRRPASLWTAPRGVTRITRAIPPSSMRSKIMNHLHTASDRSSSATRSSHVGVRCLPDALSALRQAHVSLVRFEYSGQAGARRNKPTTFHDNSGRVIDAGLPKRLRQDIDVFLHELLDLRFPDWG